MYIPRDWEFFSQERAKKNVSANYCHYSLVESILAIKFCSGLKCSIVSPFTFSVNALPDSSVRLLIAPK